MLARLERIHVRACDACIWLCLRIAVAIDDHRRWLHRAAPRLAGSIRRVLARWLGLPSTSARRAGPRNGAPPWNRTPPETEAAVVRLHVEHRDLGAGRLGQLARRTLVAIERVRWPTAAEVIRILDATFADHGVPARLLTDNGSVFTAFATQAFFVERGVDHTRTRPAHPWTNGRIERLFRTFRSTVFAHVWLFASTEQIDRYCRDFVTFYNRDRPHSRFGGRTPDEVHAGREPPPAKGRVEYFDGRLRWYRFG